MTPTDSPAERAPGHPSTFPMPGGACDCHTHVFGPAAQYSYAAQRHYTPGEASVQAQLELHRRLGVRRTVIVQPSPYGSDNRCTLDATLALNADGAQRARAVVVIAADTTAVQLRDMHATGARGVRVNLETNHLADVETARALLRDAAHRVADLGWHVQVYTNLHVVAGLRDTVARLPVPVVFDHFAGARAAPGLDQPGMDAFMDLLAGGNVYVKLSAAQRISVLPDYADALPLARAWIRARPDRMLWGTDWPHPGAWPGVQRDPATMEPFHPVDDAAALARLADWAPDEGTRAAILADNPARLYGW